MRRAPAFEALLLAGALDPLLDVADALEVLVQLVVVVAADARLEARRFRLHRVEDAAIEGAAGAVADEAIEGARRVDLLGRRLARRDPRQARAVDHREPVLEPQLVGLDAEHEARDRGLVADGVGDDLIHRRAGADHVGIEADRRAREQVHAAEVRAGRDERRLAVQPADEDHVLAVRQHRRQAGPELHRRAGALGPPVRRLDAVREEHDAEAQRRPAGGLARGAGGGRRGAFLRQQRHRLEPRQRQGDADAAEEVTPGVVEGTDGDGSWVVLGP